MGVADDDAFACGEAVGFDDDGDGEAAELFADLIEGGADGVGGGGDVVALHEFFGEGLAGFELRGGLGGAEDAEAALSELVDEAEGEREFRADDGECGLLCSTTLTTAARLPASTGMQRASWAMPPLPGAQTTSVTLRPICGAPRPARARARHHR